MVKSGSNGQRGFVLEQPSPPDRVASQSSDCFLRILGTSDFTGV